MFNQYYSIQIKCNECNKNINQGSIVSKKIKHYIIYVIKGYLKMKSKKQQVVIRNINVHLNKEQERVWNQLTDLDTHGQRVQHFINYYTVNNNKGHKEHE